MELDLGDGEGEEVCRRAKSRMRSPAVREVRSPEGTGGAPDRPDEAGMAEHGLSLLPTPRRYQLRAHQPSPIVVCLHVVQHGLDRRPPRIATGTHADVAWRVNAERLMLFAWARAILMQFAHPLIASGVAEHSTFRGGAVAAAARLHHTVRAMLSLTFGDEGNKARTLETIRTIHRRVHGRLPEAVGPFAAGTPYSAEDPRLLLWVHATLLDSILPLYDRLIYPLSTADRDMYCVEAAPTAVALGAHDADVPRTWVALRRYVETMLASGTIVVGAQARELANALLIPSHSPLVWPAARLNRLVTIALLPARVREEYGYAWGPAAERRATLALGVMKAGRRSAPMWLAHWPEARRPYG
jgi:uncharacterized protein (DUF2236 family)